MMKHQEYGEREYGRPSLLAALALMAGMIWSSAIGLTSIFIPVIIAATASVVGWRMAERRPAPTIAFLLLFFGAGMGIQSPLNTAELSSRQVIASAETLPGSVYMVEGRLRGEPRNYRTGASVWLAEGSTLSKSGEEFRINVPVPVFVSGGRDSFDEFAPGDSLLFVGSIRDIIHERNSRDYEGWLATQGAVFQFRAREWQQTGATHSPWGSFRLRMRQIADAIEDTVSAMAPEKQAGLINALVLGRTAGLHSEQREAFTRSGLMHLFAVSGLHAGLVGVMLAAIATIAGFGSRWRAAIVIGGLILFCTMIGLKTSSLRASLMISVFFLQPLVKRNIEPLAALSSIAMFILLVRPRALWQVDFQLSFLCAGTLIIMSPAAIAIEEYLGHRIKNSWRLHWRVFIRLSQLFFLSFCLQLTLMPLLASRLGTVSFISPLSNMLVLPLMVFIMAASFLAIGVTFLLGPLGEIIFAPLSLSIHGLDQLARLFASIPGAAVENTVPWPASAVGAYYMLLLSGNWLHLRPRFTPFEKAFAGARQVTAALLVVIWMPFFQPERPHLSITFIDVGQGDAILVQTREETMLVDSGPPHGPKLEPMLRERGVDSLDMLVLTHADADHIGGASGLIRNMRVGKMIVGGTLADTELWEELGDTAELHNIVVTKVRRGANWEMSDGVTVEVLHPTEDFVDEGDDRNDASVVMMVRCGEVSFLLTGDAEKEAEVSILNSIESDRLACTVLKAGHHGSHSSTSMPFLLAARPRAAVVSCGRDNRYGHPHTAVLARLQEMNADIFRTDLQGDIVFETDGEEMTIRSESFLPVANETKVPF